MPSPTPALTISDISDISQIIIAIVNVFFVGYIFLYTRRKDNVDAFKNLMLQEQNINLQWFKELIIQPNFGEVISFFSEITTISQRLLNTGLSTADKIIIADEIKTKHSKLRKSFVDILRIADPALENVVKNNLDTLIGILTVAIHDDGINLTHPPAFEKEILNKIRYSKNDLIASIYRFRGQTP